MSAVTPAEWMRGRVDKLGTDELTIMAGISDHTRVIHTKNLVEKPKIKPFHVAGTECVAHYFARMRDYQRSSETGREFAMRMHRSGTVIVTGFSDTGFCQKCRKERLEADKS